MGVGVERVECLVKNAAEFFDRGFDGVHAQVLAGTGAVGGAVDAEGACGHAVEGVAFWHGFGGEVVFEFFLDAVGGVVAHGNGAEGLFFEKVVYGGNPSECYYRDECI